MEDTLEELIRYTHLVWGDDWTTENLAAYKAIVGLTKFLDQHPATEELFEKSK
ncbi:hypothetical protein [Bacillus sp. ISL-55]|uniref:hypothetical protein n=1 Tax=Bacillus sp. ISL-55 TaxID=2819134 RepID=UPI001BE5A612|nr:hypothetical protein [Bacillus sp. ISL-55]MBT2693154.1 hypothetical protein [Bacillus sp. ISL-55]